MISLRAGHHSREAGSHSNLAGRIQSRRCLGGASLEPKCILIGQIQSAFMTCHVRKRPAYTAAPAVDLIARRGHVCCAMSFYTCSSGVNWVQLCVYTALCVLCSIQFAEIPDFFPII